MKLATTRVGLVPIVLAALGAALIGCEGAESPASGAGPDATLSSKSFRIVGGSAESGYAAVGALVEQGEAFCTGTLVAPTTVVTAAHCFSSDDPSGLSFFFGANANSGQGTSVAVESVHPHPDYQGGDHDIAVVRLTQAAPVSAIPILTETMDASWQGKDLVFVGYGVTGANKDDAGKKRSVTIALAEVMAHSFSYEHASKNTCFGDSGGPALAKVAGVTRLVGVTSYGDEGCAVYGVNTRVDTYQSWVGGFLDGAPSVPSDSSQGGQSAPEDQGDLGGDDEGDLCAAMGYYGDGICDIGCAKPDTADCADVDTSDDPWADMCDGHFEDDGFWDEGGESPDGAGEGWDDSGEGWDDSGEGWDDSGEGWDDSGEGSEWGDEGDWCAEEGFYGDGICDEGCAQPDPDCF